MNVMIDAPRWTTGAFWRARRRIVGKAGGAAVLVGAGACRAEDGEGAADPFGTLGPAFGEMVALFLALATFGLFAAIVYGLIAAIGTYWQKREGMGQIILFGLGAAVALIFGTWLLEQAGAVDFGGEA